MLFLLSGCSNLYDPESSQDQHSAVIANLIVGDHFTQSFTSANPGLSLVELYVSASPDPVSGAGKFNISLDQGTGELMPISSREITFTTRLESSEQRITFQPRFGAENQTYLLSVSAEEGSIQLLGKNENVNSNGKAKLNGYSLDADLGIELSYQYGFPILLNDIKNIIPSTWLILPILFIFLIPGWLLLKLSGLNTRYDFGENIAISLGLNISFFAILLSWTSFFNLHWNRTSAILFTLFLCIGFIVLFFKNFQSRLNSVFISTPFLLGIIFLVALVTRLIMVRDLAAPAWVDSVHHALITRLIVDQGGLPKTLQPYLEVSGSAYHSGLHSLFAFFQWLTNMETHRVILILGQFLNAFFIFSVYLFSNSLVKNRTAALVSAIIVAVLSPMPAYYTSWGRYPQLAGLAIFPVSVSLLHQLWNEARAGESQRRSFIRIAAVLSITLAGMALTHYRVVIFFFGYLLIEFGLHQFEHIFIEKFHKLNMGATIKLLIVGFLFFILLIPWFINTTAQIKSYNLIPQSAIPAFQGISTDYLTSANGWSVLIFAGIGFVLGLITRKKFILILGMWVGFLFFIANMGVFRLPGSTFVNNNSVIISLFLPLSALAGYAISSILSFCQNHIEKKYIPLFNYLVLIIFGGVLCFGASQIITILNPVTFLAREADFKAMAAIRTMTSEEDTILVNPFLWGYNLYAGSDGGYWLSASANRITMPPPVIYGMSDDTSYRKMVRKISSEVIAASDKPDSLAKLMREYGIQYLYLGSRGGVISAKNILRSSEFIVRYHQDNVWLFQVTPTAGFTDNE